VNVEARESPVIEPELRTIAGKMSKVEIDANEDLLTAPRDTLAGQNDTEADAAFPEEAGSGSDAEGEEVSSGVLRYCLQMCVLLIYG
jgi:hypothetical protein